MSCDSVHPTFGQCLGSGPYHDPHYNREGTWERAADEPKLPERKRVEDMNADLVEKVRRINEHRSEIRKMSRDRNLAEGKGRKEEGIGQVLDNTPDWYKDEFRSEVERQVKAGAHFTSEDITVAVGFPSDARGLDPDTDDAARANNGVGAMMNALARKGVIRKVGTRSLAQRPNQHSAEVNVWGSPEESPEKPPLRDFG